MKKCIYCKSNIDNDATVCPFCRREQSSSDSFLLDLFVRIGIIGVILVGIAYLYIKYDYEPQDTYKTMFDKSSYLNYKVDKVEKDKYEYKIIGIVTNTSSHKIEQAYITFSCFDKQGNQIGSATDSVANLNPNGTWKFEASYFGQADKCEFEEISAY